MALTVVALPLTLSGGIDTKTDSKSVPTTQLLALENGQFAKGTTIVKRTGYDALPSTVDGADPGATYGTPVALAARGAELCLFSESRLFSYRESSSTWSDVGPAASIAHIERAIAATGTDQSLPDIATVDGVSVVAWEDSRGGIWWAVVEQATGRTLRPAEQLTGSGILPRVVAVGSALHIYYADAAGGQIVCYPINPASYLDAPIPTVITTDLSTTTPYFDAVRHDDSIGDHPALIAWTNNAAAPRVGYVDAAGILGGSSLPGPATIAAGSDGPIAVAWTDSTAWGGAGGVGVFFIDGGVGTLSVQSPSLLSTVLGTGNHLTGGPTAGVALTFAADGAAWAWAENTATLPQDSYVTAGAMTLAVPNATLITIRGHGLVSRGFTDASGPCVALVHEVPFFPYVGVLRFSDSDAPVYACVARLVVGSSDGLPTRGHLATVEQDADDARIWRVPLLAREQVSATPGVAQFTETGIRVARLDFDSAEAYQAAEFGPDLILAGACPLRYDGDTIAELGFHTAPDGTITLTESTTHASAEMASSKTYLYQLCYEERDAAGQIHRGAMSVPQSITLTSAGTGVTLAIPTYRLTSKRRVTIGVWRSIGDDTSDDPLLYRVSSLDPSATGANGYVLNDTGADTVTFLDMMPDATLITKERAYTNSGVLSNDPIGLGHVMIASKDRLFWNDPTDPNVVRYSQRRLDGYGPEVPADLSIRVPGGAITALATLDTSVLVFSAAEVRRFSGDGPLPNPDAAPQIDFSPPDVVTGDVGCTSQRSIAITSDRILFKSSRGIYQIGRDYQVAYVGAPVEGYNAQDVVSADAVPGKTQVIFLTSSGRTLLFDYFFGQWSTFTNHEGLDAIVVAGRYHYVRASAVDLRVFRANPSSYLDATAEIPLALETAWVKLGGYHQGWQKVWHAAFLGTYKSPHLLRVSVATDYRPGFSAPYDLDVDANYVLDPYGAGVYGLDVYGGAADTLYQRRIHVGGTCKAVEFRIEDVTSGAPLGASFELTELLITGGVLKAIAPFGRARSI